MNRKQLACMWCGIAAIASAGLTVVRSYGLVSFYGFSVWVFIVILITGGLIYTFKEPKDEDRIQDIRSDILKKRRLDIRKEDRQVAQSLTAKEKSDSSDSPLQ